MAATAELASNNVTSKKRTMFFFMNSQPTYGECSYETNCQLADFAREPGVKPGCNARIDGNNDDN
jgi:hypothetical protein